MIGACGAVYCLLAVLLGAWLSHGSYLAEETLHSVEIAVRYQFWHGLALLIFTVLPIAHRSRRIVASSTAVGCLLFSGSIYSKALFGMTEMGWLAPVGGSLLMFSWAYLIFVFIKERHA